MHQSKLDAMRRAAQSAIFFGLAGCAGGLIYLVAAPRAALPHFIASRIEAPQPKIDSSRPAPIQAAPEALEMEDAPSISESGACIAIENFRSQVQASSAKALLSSGPLREKSWVVSTPVSAQHSAGVVAASASEARAIAKTFSQKGLPPLSIGPAFVVFAKADSPESAVALVEASGAASGFKITSRLSAPASERKSIVTLPQTKAEIQFARSLSARLPGATISAAPCPDAAEPFLDARAAVASH